MTTTEELKVVISAENKTAKAFGEVKKSTGLLQKDVSGLAKTLLGIGVAGAAAFTSFAISAVRGAADAEASLARVDTILKTMGESALKNRDALLAQAAAAVKMGFDDEAAAESLAKLYQRTGDLTKATELNNLAMDLARAKSIDLESASRLVGMVMSGNARALKEFGIEIDETLPPMAALGVLQEKVAGQSEAFAETFQGKMLVISESVSNLKDAFGSALIEGLQPFVDSMTKWVSDPKNLETITTIGKAVGKFLTEAFKFATLSIEGFKLMFDALTDSIYIKGLVKIIETVEKLASAFEKAASAARKVTGGSDSGGSVSGAFSGKAKKVNDVIITPSGQAYETHPDDYIFATKNPAAMGGGSGPTINVFNPVVLDEKMVSKMGDQVAALLKREMRL